MLSSTHCFLQAWAAWFSTLKSTYSHAFSVHLYYWILHHQAQSLSKEDYQNAWQVWMMRWCCYIQSPIDQRSMCPQTAEERINSPQTKELTLVHGLTDLYIQPTACCKVLINQKRRMSLSILAEISRAQFTLPTANVAEPLPELLNSSKTK